jgi:hypothetical protein
MGSGLHSRGNRRRREQSCDAMQLASNGERRGLIPDWIDR